MSPAPSANKSTGPRTPAGKERSRLNATRHGLTGRVVVLPGEDMNAYIALCATLLEDLAPETPVEHQLAQTICDTQWRLNRARSIEDSLFALGHFEDAADIDVDHPEVHAALTAARAFRADSKSFLNLSLYEQRLQRTLKESFRQLRELQAERRASCESAEDVCETPEAAPVRPAAVARPAQFVFASPESAGEIRPFSPLTGPIQASRSAMDFPCVNK